MTHQSKNLHHLPSHTYRESVISADTRGTNIQNTHTHTEAEAKKNNKKYIGEHVIVISLIRFVAVSFISISRRATPKLDR